MIRNKRRKYPELKDIKLKIKEFKYVQNSEYGKNYTKKKIWENSSVLSSPLWSS